MLGREMGAGREEEMFCFPRRERRERGAVGGFCLDIFALQQGGGNDFSFCRDGRRRFRLAWLIRSCVWRFLLIVVVCAWLVGWLVGSFLLSWGCIWSLVTFIVYRWHGITRWLNWLDRYRKMDEWSGTLEAILHLYITL